MSAFISNPIVMQLGEVGLFREWLKDNPCDYTVGAIDIIERQDGGEELIFMLNRDGNALSTFASVGAALRYIGDAALTHAFERYLLGFSSTRFDRLQDAVRKA
ncbi:hypothetical protein SAMN06265795_10978 [Noviherbaspirillum humi]|uniref:Uncharacterized protein n=1 Tax=Noviherbaspirillum humi TaxID=1688639 RepID=A0A239IEY9_9BURK|nr:hypothetical protein [Noviherbaspirillum humi]SNS92099.1 hypothetical protein SAMN06265795_10978 [Noviherbaspirillum humi]